MNDLTPLEFTIVALAASVGMLVVLVVLWHVFVSIRERRAESARAARAEHSTPVARYEPDSEEEFL